MTNSMTLKIPRTRLGKLQDELAVALAATSRHDLWRWGRAASWLLLKALARRGRGVLGASWRLGKFAGRETTGLIKALHYRRLGKHLAQRGRSSAAALHRSLKTLPKYLAVLRRRLLHNPTETAPQILTLFLGFILGSGGLDGDGGIPDLDLQAGIGAHRSILTHSIFAAALLETLLLSVTALAELVYQRLPQQHDIFWDRLLTAQKRLLIPFSTGACAGIAYHLFVDAAVDTGKAYADLPLSLPMAAHQSIMAGNAAAEGLDVQKKLEGYKV